MWSTHYSAQTKASPSAIWKLWHNVQTWTDWDHEISYCKIEGDFQEGVKGRLKPKGGPETKFVLTYVEPMKGFSDRSFLPLATVDFIHKIESRDGKVFIEHRVEMKGPSRDAVVIKQIMGARLVKPHSVPVIRVPRKNPARPLVISGAHLRVPRTWVCRSIINQVEFRIIRNPTPDRPPSYLPLIRWPG